MGLADRRNGAAGDSSLDDAESHGLPCVPDANAMAAGARWCHGSRAGIKRFLSTGDQGSGYSKLETTTAAQPDWRDVDAAFVSLLLVRFLVCIYSCTPAPPIWSPLHAGSFRLRDIALSCFGFPPFTLFLFTGIHQDTLFAKPPFFVAVQLFNLFPPSYRNSSSAGRLTTSPIAISFLQKNTSKHSPL
jgi:hypothetical protein